MAVQAKFSGFQKLLVIAVVGWSIVASLPNVLSKDVLDKFPSWLPTQRMTLGLDLQGGAHLVMEISMADVMNQAYQNLEDNVRVVAREKKIGYSGMQANADALRVTAMDPSAESVFRSELLRDGVLVYPEGNNVLRLVFDDARLTEMRSRAMGQTLQVLRSRVDEFGVAEPVIQQLGDNRVIVELPGVKDVARAKAAIGRTAQLTFHMVDDNADPNALMVAPNKLKLEEQTTDDSGKVIASQPLIVTKRPALTGEMLTSASPGYDQYGAPAVDIAFDSRGTRAFAKISTENVGKRFAIVLDGKVFSAPVFREPILGGRAQISGRFTLPEAQDLAAVLNAGALPAKLVVAEERTIGPSLGADSVNAGLSAMVGGLIAVLLFMILFYGLFGFFADLALIVNLTILVAVMSAMGFTLTLPGMAGIVLTLGMAVDANVLIFERMREEVDHGKRPLAALLGGFEGAFKTIVDGHVTTLVAAIVLFAIGSGPVKGFAVSLTIGLMASLFTSITLTRWLILAWVHRVKPQALPI